MPVAGIQIPSRTPITVRMMEKSIPTSPIWAGRFAPALMNRVLVNGQTLIPRGEINGQMIDTTTGNVSEAEARPLGQRPARAVGGGAEVLTKASR